MLLLRHKNVEGVGEFRRLGVVARNAKNVLTITGIAGASMAQIWLLTSVRHHYAHFALADTRVVAFAMEIAVVVVVVAFRTLQKQKNINCVLTNQYTIIGKTKMLQTP